MKKFLTFVLALVMVCSLSVTAFAETGTTTITAVVPEEKPFTYYFFIPADTTIEYGNTKMQKLDGKVQVNYSGDLAEGRGIRYNVAATQLSDGLGHTIETLYMDGPNDDNLLTGGPYYAVAHFPGEGVCLFPRQFYVKVPSWEGAVPGTYTATMTFTFWISDESDTP